MAITDLTGTTWIWNDNISDRQVDPGNLNFVSNGKSFTLFLVFEESANQYMMVYAGQQPGGTTVLDPNDGWIDDAYKTITFTGGESVQSQYFINYLYANATLVNTTPVEVSYNNTLIHTAAEPQTITLDTAGKYCESDIEIKYNLARGSASTPATTITANPTITIDSGGVITATASASQSVTPTVSEGYVEEGTAGTITVSGTSTAQIPSGSATTPATTITPTINVSLTTITPRIGDPYVTVNATASGSKSITPTVTPGYVNSGTAGLVSVSGLGYLDLTTLNATTYHPSTSDQTIAKDQYLGGAQTIKGVLLTNLTAANIKKDVVVKVGDSTDDDCVTSVTGTYEGSGGATKPYTEETYDSSDNLIAASLYGYTIIPGYKFYNKTRLASLPTADDDITAISAYAFYKCTSMVVTDADMQSTIGTLGNNAFYDCTKVAITKFPNSSTAISGSIIAGGACRNTGIVNIEIGAASVGSQAFMNCSNLSKVWFRSTCTAVTASTAANSPFNGCPTGLKIYCEASSKPSGYGTYFNRTGSSGGTTVSVVYNRTTKPW